MVRFGLSVLLDSHVRVDAERSRTHTTIIITKNKKAQRKQSSYRICLDIRSTKSVATFPKVIHKMMKLFGQKNFRLSLSLAVIIWGILFQSSSALIYEKNRNLCAGQPIITKKHERTLQWLMKNIGETQIKSGTSPQHEAACWMLRSKAKFSPQRFVMGVMYYATKGSKWDINTDWMTHKHECTWYGVQCNMFKTIIGLDLGYIKVDGLIPREIGLLTNLKDLDLHGNDLQGVIPHKLMAGLKQLEYLRLHMNGMFGSLHKEIARMKNLKERKSFGRLNIKKDPLFFFFSLHSPVSPF